MTGGRRVRLAAVSWIALAASAPLVVGAEGSATPQRPSLSFNTATVARGSLEIETGGTLADGGDALPVFLKYGITDRTVLEAGFDALRRVETPSGVVDSHGDLQLGVRSRVHEGGRGRSAAFAAWVKAPTARDEAGSGEFDFVGAGILTLPAGACALDLNLWIGALGRPGGSRVGQVQGIATLNLPATGGWSPFAEIALQKTATEGSGGFVDVRAAWAASRRAVFDVAIGAGGSEGYPDWSVTLGWTFLVGRAFDPR